MPRTNGKSWPSGEYERIGMDICKTSPNVVYALIDRLVKDSNGRENDGAYLYRSNDKGDSWQLVEGNDRIKAIYPGYGWVFGQVRVDPANADIVYVMGINYMRSKDGGKT